MTAATRRRTVAEMEARLAMARELIETMIEYYEADLTRYRAQVEAESPSRATDMALAHVSGVLDGFRASLEHLTDCFDTPGRDWMYRT